MPTIHPPTSDALVDVRDEDVERFLDAGWRLAAAKRSKPVQANSAPSEKPVAAPADKPEGDAKAPTRKKITRSGK